MVAVTIIGVLHSAQRTAHSALPPLRAQGGGDVVIVSSVVGRWSGAGRAEPRADGSAPSAERGIGWAGSASKHRCL